MSRTTDVPHRHRPAVVSLVVLVGLIVTLSACGSSHHPAPTTTTEDVTLAVKTWDLTNYSLLNRLVTTSTSPSAFNSEICPSLGPLVREAFLRPPIPDAHLQGEWHASLDDLQAAVDLCPNPVGAAGTRFATLTQRGWSGMSRTVTDMATLINPLTGFGDTTSVP